MKSKREKKDSLFWSFLKSLTLAEREKKELSKFQIKLDYYCGLSELELTLKYVEIKSKLDYNKSVGISVIVVVLLSIIFGVWNIVMNLMADTIDVYIRQNNSVQESIIIFIVILLFLTTVLIVFLISFVFSLIKNMRINTRELLIVEEVRKKRGL